MSLCWPIIALESMASATSSKSAQFLPALLQEKTHKQQNFIIRPHRPTRAGLIRLDDLNAAAAERIAPHAFMVLRLTGCSGKAMENGEGYALLTAQNAAAAVERRGQPVKSTPHP